MKSWISRRPGPGSKPPASRALHRGEAVKRLRDELHRLKHRHPWDSEPPSQGLRARVGPGVGQYVAQDLMGQSNFFTISHLADASFLG